MKGEAFNEKFKKKWWELDKMNCLECGSEITARQINCPKCGRKLGDPKIELTLTGSLSADSLELPKKIEKAINELIKEKELKEK